MKYTAEQIKGKIKALGIKKNCDPRLLIRIYMMERILERLSLSKYKECFVLKGGMLVTSLVGISQRTTMDIDATIRNFDLNEENAKSIITEIINVDADDDIKFSIKKVEDILADMEYPGIRLYIDASIEKMIVPIKIDISTGDVITPKEIEYKYKLLLEDREIDVYSYNLETVFAEKVEAILTRGIAGTRMRDFYDIYTLTGIYDESIDYKTLSKAFKATCNHRGIEGILGNEENIVSNIASDEGLKTLWNNYRKKYTYAENIEFEDTVKSLEKLINRIK